MTNLKNMDWSLIENLIDEMLNDHMRTWGWYDYLIIDEDTVLVKVHDEDTDRLMFTIKAKLVVGKLEIVEAK